MTIRCSAAKSDANAMGVRRTCPGFAVVGRHRKSRVRPKAYRTSGSFPASDRHDLERRETDWRAADWEQSSAWRPTSIRCPVSDAQLVRSRLVGFAQRDEICAGLAGAPNVVSAHHTEANSRPMDRFARRRKPAATKGVAGNNLRRDSARRR